MRNSYRHMTYEECAARYPRLIRKMQWVAILSSSEAACALRDYRSAREALTGNSPYQNAPGRHCWKAWGTDMLRFGGCEAVAHYGGLQKLVNRAAECRHVVQS